MAKASGALREEKFQELLLQCYEREERWAESLPRYAELGIEQTQREWLDYAKKRAAWPRMEVTFTPGTSAVPCVLQEGEWVVVHVTVNGVSGRVVLDTGAETGWWTKEFAARAGLERVGETATLRDSQGVEGEAEVVVVRELQLGGMKVRNVVGAAGESAMFARRLGADGILGWDVLRQAHLVFDFPMRRVEVSAPAGGIVADPALGGRVGPIVLARSTEGKPLHLWLDTGAASDTGGVDLFETDGLIGTKMRTDGFRRRLRPVRSEGLNANRREWPREMAPFSFWLAGYWFETPLAHLRNREELHDGWSYLDGVIGNASFLSGRLTLCGVRRLVAFEPGTAAEKRLADMEPARQR